MNLVGRYERLRGMVMHEGGYTPPVILDKGRAQDAPRLLPYARSEEWWKSKDGRWLELWKIGQAARHLIEGQEGAVGYYGDSASMYPYFGYPVGDAAATTTTSALTTNYLPGTNGQAISSFGAIPTTKTLNHFYFHVTSIAGSPNSVNYEVRANAASNLPDTTATLAAGVVDPAGNIGWMRANASAIGLSLTRGTLYHFIIGDADGAVGTAVTVIRNWNTNMFVGIANWYYPLQAYFTTNGWIAKTAGGSASPHILVFSDGTAIGYPLFASATTSTSNTAQKGLYVAGFKVGKTVWGMASDSSGTNVSEIRIWEGSNGPSGSGYKDHATPLMYSSGTTLVGGLFSTEVTLSPSTAYRFVFYGTSNFTTPATRSIGTVATAVNSGSAADLTPAMPGGGNWYYTTESGGAWVDTTTSIPSLVVWVTDDVAGGGGGSAGTGLGAIITG